MPSQRLSRLSAGLLAGSALASMTLAGCAGNASGPQLPSASFVSMQEGPGEDYVIGPLDQLTIFVWRNPELGASVQVRPDGRITTPLITDMPAVGKTPSMLAEDIKLQLSQYIEEPIVSVIVNSFAGTFSQQIRVVGATGKPASIPYRANMILSNKTYSAEELYDLGLVHILAQPGEGAATLREFMQKSDRRHAGLVNAKRALRVSTPIELSEFYRIVDLWADAALQLRERDLRLMSRLAAAQERLAAA